MAIPADFLDELRARVGLGEIIGRRVRLSRRGRELIGLCPFHHEKTPSFTVNEAKGFYHCFGCGAHGSVIDFVMEQEGTSFREAVERLAGEVGLHLPEEQPEEAERTARRRTLLEVTERAARWYERQLRMPAGQAALDYLHRRSVGDDLIARFRLGFAPENGSALKAALGQDGIDDAVLAEAGLVIRPEEPGRRSYDRFRGRVMFPIADGRGRVIAFGGRVLAGGEPKYLNSPETPLFHKGRTLYGLDLASRPVRLAGTVIVAEGYMDVIGLHRAGWPNVVAPLGTALTADQLNLLWRIAAEPVLLFDPDPAGERAALRAAEQALPLLKSGLGLRFARLRVDTGDDPDGVARRFERRFLDRALADALPLSAFLRTVIAGGRRLDTPERRARAEADLTRYAHLVADRSMRDHFLKDFRRHIRLAAGPVRSGRQVPLEPVISAEAAVAAGATTGDGVLREAILLAVLINHPELAVRIGERLGATGFSDTELDVLRQAALEVLAARPDLDSAALASQLTKSGYSASLERVLSPRVLGHAFFARSDQPTDTALEGWEETFAAYRRRTLRADIDEHKRMVGRALDDPRRYVALEAIIREQRTAGPDSH